MTAQTLEILQEESCRPEDLRGALRHIAATVFVAATTTDAGAFFATTATAVLSISLEPPTLAVCLNRSNAMAQNLAVGSKVSLCALAGAQKDVAAACAGGSSHEDRKALFHPAEEADQYYLEGAEASFLGRCVEMINIGTHSLCVVRVHSVVFNETVEPLLYLNGAYGAFEARA